ncbi:MAG: hypothetical protein U0835_08270 [Isosphaeraceae bacterium]
MSTSIRPNVVARPWTLALSLAATLTVTTAMTKLGSAELSPRPHLKIRGIYGGVPTDLMENGQTLSGSGVNAVWVGSGGLNAEIVRRLKDQGALVFAEFNTMHDASFLKDSPDAAPVGTDGATCPPPNGWQGVCPTHPGYRRARMEAFRKVLAELPVDGIWLDYHHSHASWEQAVPDLPDTCFCRRCLNQFRKDTGTNLPDDPVPDLARRLLGPLEKTWVDRRCGVFTDWVREFKSIRDEVRPKAKLGTFHCPWSDTDFDGSLRDKLAIDLKAQAPYFDVLSPMPYHARFGHVSDPAWISRQTAWLGGYLGLKGEPSERLRIWPIVQLSDWGEPVPAGQVAEVLDHGTRLPATGVMTFVWGTLRQSPEKVAAMTSGFRSMRP